MTASTTCHGTMAAMPKRPASYLLLVIWLGATVWWLAAGHPSPHLPAIQVNTPVLVRPVPSVDSFARAALSSPHLPKSVTLEGITLDVIRTSRTTAHLCLSNECAVINTKTRSIQTKAP